MNEKFFDIKKEKQDRIINAALKVFARNGYKHASTDDIVSEAGISKGLLFHYFISKLGLYEFLHDYSVRFMHLELSTRVSKKGNDFFLLREQIEGAKLQVMKNYPYMQQFIDSIPYENVKEALLATEEKKYVLKETIEGILAQADLSRFREEADPAMISLSIDYTIQGMMKKSFLEDSFHPDMMAEEINGYLHMVRNLSYHP
ncbi:TetR/AcrR family transcriptional regulator [Kineothrix sp. MB12-C1]|uniref:TetR/AcrR family transcriptional regulator n=1 Tax=Kineothrix sp. MB12-C1 TaxID=3070215 RepID=UPI0027D2A7F8|nr:TetR/AcrR family transcriptional regulator [Kineothrix sp. MB12-C1]WMC91853.1 TetR/AcrR family transcriptional regulator [Kineothrix sp. MB12-C1]